MAETGQARHLRMWAKPASRHHGSVGRHLSFVSAYCSSRASAVRWSVTVYLLCPMGVGQQGFALARIRAAKRQVKALRRARACAPVTRFVCRQKRPARPSQPHTSSKWAEGPGSGSMHYKDRRLRRFGPNRLLRHLLLNQKQIVQHLNSSRHHLVIFYGFPRVWLLYPLTQGVITEGSGYQESFSRVSAKKSIVWWSYIHGMFSFKITDGTVFISLLCTDWMICLPHAKGSKASI